MAKIYVLLYNQHMKIFEGMHKYIWLELAVWLMILCFVVAGIRIYFYNREKNLVTYQIFMPDVDGIIVGSPVKFMGVQVGYIERVKIVSNDVYLKIVITDKDVELPKGSIATVEFNGMGGSKSLEVYPPTKESLAADKLIVVQNPKRLHDSLGLLNDMFDKIGSISTKLSFFARETGVTDMSKGINTAEIQTNMTVFEKLIKEFAKIEKEGVKYEQGKSENNK